MAKFQSSNDGMRLTEEDAARVAALLTYRSHLMSNIHMTEENAASFAAFHTWARVLRKIGRLKEAWEQDTLALSLVNRSTLQALSSGAFESDEPLTFCELLDAYPGPTPRQKGVHLTLLLVDGSPLAREVIEVLRRHASKEESHNATEEER